LILGQTFQHKRTKKGKKEKILKFNKKEEKKPMKKKGEKTQQPLPLPKTKSKKRRKNADEKASTFYDKPIEKE